MATAITMTEEGYKALKKELEELKTVKREEISEKIRVARGYGDLSENSEYDEAKNDQALVEARISLVEDQLKNAVILDTKSISTEKVSIGTKVVLLDTEFGDEMEYRIVTAVESKSAMDAITAESPVGEAIMGKRVGDEVVVKAPIGDITYQIKKISI